MQENESFKCWGEAPKGLSPAGIILYKYGVCICIGIIILIIVFDLRHLDIQVCTYVVRAYTFS